MQRQRVRGGFHAHHGGFDLVRHRASRFAGTRAAGRKTRVRFQFDPEMREFEEALAAMAPKSTT
jgi:hypothetical protein